jgi:hypothetical protein
VVAEGLHDLGQGAQRQLHLRYSSVVDAEQVREADGPDAPNPPAPTPRRRRRTVEPVQVTKAAAVRQPHGPARTAILLDADTLDVQHVFCADCRAWCDLQADAEEADRLLGPWPGGAEWRSRVRREED